MTIKKYDCPALIVSAMASGQGKTTVTAAIARYFNLQGYNVQVFKTGPDFIDPLILETASQNPVLQLDLWMAGETYCRELLYEAAKAADLILIEGVMGLFDGDSSTADLAIAFSIPVMTVIDASAMAQTFSAIAFGLSEFNRRLNFAGVFANRVGSDYHHTLLKANLSKDIQLLGWLPYNKDVSFPERHLGLHLANEIDSLDSKISLLANNLQEENLNAIDKVNFFSDQIDTSKETETILSNKTIAIAKDAAFSFIYHDNINTLTRLGASVCYFSPLKDNVIPYCDALYFPGGYPELYLNELSANKKMHQSIKKHHDANKPVLAECGGMMYLCESITTTNNITVAMSGILKASCTMQPRLSALAYQHCQFTDGTLRGHTFHHSTLQSNLQPVNYGHNPGNGQTREAIFKEKNTTASYIHFYFSSNPLVTARFFEA